jgi:heme/copper-type cytochrome/quinol oxidase subunit 2
MSVSPISPPHSPLPRRLSVDSSSSYDTVDNYDNTERHGSSAALILVHDDSEELAFDFDSDADGEDEESNGAQFNSSSLPPLSPTAYFIYLLSPNLKLGAMLLPNSTLSLAANVVALLFFALASTFSRQIWYLLGRHLGRNADLEDVVLDTFARRRSKEGRRALLSGLVRASTGIFRILLAAIYLRDAVRLLSALIPKDLVMSQPLFMTVFLSVMLLPFLSAKSLSWGRVIASTWLSLAFYIIWLVLVIVTYSTGQLRQTPDWQNRGVLWQGFTTTAFTFTSSSTLSLYAAFKSRKRSAASKPKSRSSRMISTVAVLVATVLILPVSLLSVYPHRTLTTRLQLPHFVSVVSGLTLYFTIPSILVSTPALPVPPRIRTVFPVSKALIFITFLLLSMAPANWSSPLNNIVLLTALLHTYFLPTFLHIVMHYLKRPHSIVVPVPNTPLPRSGSNTPMVAPYAAEHDELLLRKERAMQRRQFRKRIIWDVGVWVMLLPVSGGGFVWSVGRLVGKW